MRVVIICLASTALVSSPSLAVLHLSTYLPSVSRTASGFALPRALTRANFRRVLQQISKAAVAGDADNINKQARKERTDWINKQKNKEATNGFLSSAPVGGARAA